MSRSTTRRRRALVFRAVAAVTVLLVLSGCGSDALDVARENGPTNGTSSSAASATANDAECTLLKA
jgi:uncharacterized protein YceK